MKTKEQILSREIRICKQRLCKYRSCIMLEERQLHEAEAALKRLNEEERRSADKGVHSPTEERRTTPSVKYTATPPQRGMKR